MFSPSDADQASCQSRSYALANTGTSSSSSTRSGSSARSSSSSIEVASSSLAARFGPDAAPTRSAAPDSEETTHSLSNPNTVREECHPAYGSFTGQRSACLSRMATVIVCCASIKEACCYARGASQARLLVSPCCTSHSQFHAPFACKRYLACRRANDDAIQTRTRASCKWGHTTMCRLESYLVAWQDAHSANAPRKPPCSSHRR